jgi:putative transposase
MPRAPRTWDPGGLYHLTPKGNDGRALFLDDRERREMLHRCNRVMPAYGVVVIGFCFMDNHLHFLVRIEDTDVSGAMHVLLGGYSRSWNRTHGRDGHLFEARFHTEAVRTELHFLNVVRYIDLNPVAAGIRKRPEDWRWSSFRAHVGLERGPAFLATAEFFKYFGITRQQAIANYLRLVSGWRPPTREELRRSFLEQWQG